MVSDDQTIIPTLPSRQSQRIKILAVIVGFAILGATTWLLLRRPPAPGAVGILDRSPQPLATDIATWLSSEGDCINRYRIDLVGQTTNGTHYGVTLKLRSNPENEAALIQLLQTDTCVTQQQTILDQVDLTLGLTAETRNPILTTSYRSASGTRWSLP